MAPREFKRHRRKLAESCRASSNVDDDSNAGCPTGRRRRRKSRHSHADDDENRARTWVECHPLRSRYRTGAGIVGNGLLEADRVHAVRPRRGWGAGIANGADGGIGLALSQLIVGQHGGKIDISSEAGGGSTFSMEITLLLVRDPGVEDDSGDGRTPARARRTTGATN